MDLRSLFSLEGRIALVTGGSRGIGAMIAEGLVAAGAKVYITARSVDDLQSTAARLGGYSGECVPLPGDLSTADGIDQVAGELEEREDVLHTLVNNAGAVTRARFGAFDEADWDRVLDLNLKATFFMTQRLLPTLRRGASVNHHAAVINISSITAVKTGAQGDYAYRASKAGLNQLTRMLGKDLAPEHINVNAISPGFFRSEMTAAMFEHHTLYERFRETNPIPREGRAEEIAALAVYLASRAGGYMTGSIVDIDGWLRFVT